MDEKEKAFKRFEAKPEELKVFHRGQCADCEKNKTYDTCKAWRVKPTVYAEDKEKCPEFSKRN